MGGTAVRLRAARMLIGSCLLAATLSVGTAVALAPPSPWDGTNPFRCTIQDAGQGTAVPDPGADPYCVRFDKTNQNLTELGLIDFLTKEPARFEAAGPKCFYYQEDHWRGSVSQSDGRTVLYEFLGHYFFNKATGDGGVWVTGFRLAGQTFDPRTLPGFPPQYDQYYGPGTGGMITHNAVPVDPSCAATVNRAPGSVYRAPPASCRTGGGVVNRSRVGPVLLGMPEKRVRMRLGRPGSAKRGFLRYCAGSHGVLLVGERALGHRHRTVIVITTSNRFWVRASRSRLIRPGASLRALRTSFPDAHVALRLGRTTVMRVGRGDTGTVIAGTASGRVTYLAAFTRSAIPTGRALARYLRRAGV